MTAKLVDVRDEIYVAIGVQAAALNYTVNDFTLEKTYMPLEMLEDLEQNHSAGKVYVIGMGQGNEEQKSRTNMGLREQPVQIAYQRPGVDPTDTTNIDDYVALIEELRDTCRTGLNFDIEGGNRFSWIGTDGMEDEESQTPYSFFHLKQRQVFFAYFTPRYQLVLNP